MTAIVERPPGGYSLVVKHQPSKLAMRVRFPLPAPNLPYSLSEASAVWARSAREAVM